jgi:hypothetical protein
VTRDLHPPTQYECCWPHPEIGPAPVRPELTPSLTRQARIRVSARGRPIAPCPIDKLPIGTWWTVSQCAKAWHVTPSTARRALNAYALEYRLEQQRCQTTDLVWWYAYRRIAG